jgi:hypothetical protein
MRKRSRAMHARGGGASTLNRCVAFVADRPLDLLYAGTVALDLAQLSERFKGMRVPRIAVCTPAAGVSEYEREQQTPIGRPLSCGYALLLMGAAASGVCVASG